MSDDFKLRLKHFYSVYNPTCVDSVDAILKTYEGREQDLMKVLVAKYGPEPDPSAVGSVPEASYPPPQASTTARPDNSSTAVVQRTDHSSNFTVEPSHSRTGDSQQPSADASRSSSRRIERRSSASTSDIVKNDPAVRERVLRFYQHYNPSKVGELDTVLRAFAEQKVDMLMSNLVKKYGPEPYPVEEPEPQRSNFVMRNPSEQKPTTERLESRPGKEKGSSSEPPAAETGSGTGSAEHLPTTSVAAMVQQFDAHSVVGVVGQETSQEHPSHTAGVSGVSKEKTDEIKAPPPPTPPAATATEPTVPKTERSHQQQATVPKQSWEARFFNMFDYYCPEKLSNLGEKMERHRGTEEQWMALLVAKYGPEPPMRARASVRAPSPQQDNHARQTNFTLRLRNIYKQHEPSFLQTVDQKSAEAQAKDEEEVLQHLLARYRHSRDTSTQTEISLSTEGNDATTDCHSLVSPAPPSPEELQRSAERLLSTGQLQGRLEKPNLELTEQRNTINQLQLAVIELTKALEAKTAELSKVGKERTIARAEAEGLQSELDEKGQLMDSLQHELRDAKEALQGKTSEEVTTVQSLTSQLQEKEQYLTDLRSESEAEILRLQSTVSVREHQHRMLRMQLEHTLDELKRRDDLLDENDAVVERLRSKQHEAAEEIAALRLELTSPHDIDRFYEVTAELEQELKESFLSSLERIKLKHEEQLSKYQREVEHRDRQIESLSEALFVSSTMHRQGDPVVSQKTDAPPTAESSTTATTPTTLAPEDEIARLRTQLRVQQEEHKALMTVMSLRGPTSHRGRSADGKINLPAAEGAAMDRSSSRPPPYQEQELNQELQRHVDSISVLHSKLLQKEEAQRVSDAQIRELLVQIEALKGK